MTSTMPTTEGASRVRWVLLGSLALNLFFVGAAGAVALRYSSTVPLSTVARIDHDAARRLDRLAQTMPSTDAQLIRAELRVDAVQIAAAQADLRLSQERFRDTLRAEPFDLSAMRVALGQVQTARDKFDLVLHNVIATAAANMSVVGRNKLADWPASRTKAEVIQQ